MDEEAVAANVAGLMNLIKYFRMLPGRAELRSDVVWVDRYEVIYSGHDGLFYPRSGMGDYVKTGEVVGIITDYHGNLLEGVKAPFTGMLLYIIGTPPCNGGEPLFEVGRVKE